MSLSKPVRKQSGRVLSQKSTTMRHSTAQTKNHVRSPHRRDYTSPVINHAQPDSGYFESADSDLFSPVDKSLPSYGVNDKDWVLFDDENLHQEDGYYFNEDHATDIASVKANHGSNYNGKNNEDDTIITPRRSGAGRALEVIYESPRRNDPPQTPTHFFSYYPTTQYGVSTLDTWTSTPEQHEMNAYRMQQPPTPGQTFHGAQAWNEEIDLDNLPTRH